MKIKCANRLAYNSVDIVIGLGHDDRIDIDTFSESVEPILGIGYSHRWKVC